jgi:hypothetical protein
LENNEAKRLKWLSLILRFNLRLGGLLHMEREYFAHHI